MPKRRLIFLLLTILIFTSSCSVFRRGGPGEIPDKGLSGTKEILDCTISNNINRKDFIVSRFKLAYKSKDLNRSVSGFFKSTVDGRLLFSVRSVAGIEVARALIDSDSIKVYDRINSVLYVQSIDYLELKYGIDKEALPLLWGDIPGFIEDNATVLKAEPVFTASHQYRDINYRLNFDSKNCKLSEAETIHSNGRRAMFKYGEYKKGDRIIFPGTCDLMINGGEISIDMKFVEASHEEAINMKFRVGRNTEIVVLR